MVLLCFWHPGRLHHLEISLPSLQVEELEAFPVMISDSVQPDAGRSQDWHFDQHCHAFHTDDRAPVAHQRYSPLLVVLQHSEQRGYGNEHIPDWCFVD